jgi:hypothetical protein
LSDASFVILAVALDTAGSRAAQVFAEAENLSDVPPPIQHIMGWDEALWSRAGRPQFPCLIDETHRVARLYDIVNVPTAVWIDEQGRIVRPPESAGAFDVVKHIDFETFAIPDDVAARGRAVRHQYVDAVRDWVRKGDASAYALSPAEVQRRLHGPGEEASLATAHFQIGVHLYRAGAHEAAQPFFEEAVRLRPESWTFRRQKIAVGSEEAIGDFAATPEYWEAVEKLGDRPYYEPVDMPGMPGANAKP